MKNIKLICLIVIVFMANFSTLFSQTVIWSEDFESYDLWTSQGSGSPPKWTITEEPSPPFWWIPPHYCYVATPAHLLPFVIPNNVLFVKGDRDEDDVVIQTQTIDISGYINVSFYVDCNGMGLLYSYDSYDVHLWVDGVYKAIAWYRPDPTAYFATAYQVGINGNNLKIIMDSRIHGPLAAHFFDNIIVKGWKASSIGDFVWNDLNHDGVQDTDEPGMTGVTVELYNCANQSLVETIITNMNGNYKFERLMPGTYQVKFILPDDYAFSPQHQNNPSYYPIPRYLMDSDPYPNTGRTGSLYFDGWVDLTIDAGMYYTPCSIINLAAGNQSSCNPTDNTYAQDITVTFQYPPSSGSLIVNGQPFPIGTNPQTVTLTGLYADCRPVDVTASFSKKPECSLTIAELFLAATDCQPPTIKCPDDITVNNESRKCGAVVSYTPPVGTDICPGAITELTAGLGSGAFFPVGITTEEYTVSDVSDMTANCSFTVTVNDAENPQIACPADMTMNNDLDMCGAVVTYTPPVGTDNCPGATTERINGLGSGAFFPVGTTLEEYKVTDAAGHTATCGFNVTIIDDEPPVFMMDTDSVALWPPNHKYHTFTIEDFVLSVHDNCDGEIDIENVIISWVSSDEEENLPGNKDGNTNNDIIISIECDSTKLRSERDETSNGRVYTIHFTVVDKEGNLGEDSSFVYVPLNMSGNPIIEDDPTYIVYGECKHLPVMAEIFESEITQETTKQEPISDDYDLMQNYPNPFNPQTEITFKIPEPCDVVLKIYNIFGQEICQLAEGYYDAGVHHVQWNGTDKNGHEVSNGIYFCVLKTSTFNKVMKMSLLR